MFQHQDLSKGIPPDFMSPGVSAFGPQQACYPLICLDIKIHNMFEYVEPCKCVH